MLTFIVVSLVEVLYMTHIYYLSSDFDDLKSMAALLCSLTEGESGDVPLVSSLRELFRALEHART